MRKIAFILTIFVFAVTVVFSENSTGKTDKDFTVAKFAEKLTDTIGKNGIEAGLSLFAEVPESFSDDYSINYMHASLLVSAQKASEAERLQRTCSKTIPKILMCCS